MTKKQRLLSIGQFINEAFNPVTAWRRNPRWWRWQFVWLALNCGLVLFNASFGTLISALTCGLIAAAIAHHSHSMGARLTAERDLKQLNELIERIEAIEPPDPHIPAEVRPYLERVLRGAGYRPDDNPELLARAPQRRRDYWN